MPHGAVTASSYFPTLRQRPKSLKELVPSSEKLIAQWKHKSLKGLEYKDIRLLSSLKRVLAVIMMLYLTMVGEIQDRLKIM